MFTVPPGVDIDLEIYRDVNGNGLDDNDPRLGGVTITLRGDVDGDGSADEVSMMTNDQGEYWFEGLYPGAYTVRETPPPGSVATPSTIHFHARSAPTPRASASPCAPPCARRRR